MGDSRTHGGGTGAVTQDAGFAVNPSGACEVILKWQYRVLIAGASCTLVLFVVRFASGATCGISYPSYMYLLMMRRIGTGQSLTTAAVYHFTSIVIERDRSDVRSTTQVSPEHYVSGVAVEERSIGRWCSPVVSSKGLTCGNRPWTKKSRHCEWLPHKMVTTFSGDRYMGTISPQPRWWPSCRRRRRRGCGTAGPI